MTDEKKKYRNFLLYGAAGSGKTTLAGTAGNNILIDCFDPGGWECLEDIEGIDVTVKEWLPDAVDIAARGKGIEHAKKDRSYGKAVAETYSEWTKDFEARRDSNAFESYDVYILDSVTTIADLLMERVLHKDNRSGGVPGMQDWQSQMNTMTNIIRAVTALPCHTVVCAHENTQKCEFSGKIQTQLSVTGQLKNKLPVLFSEVWHLDANADRHGNAVYTAQTSPGGFFNLARTRMGRGGRLDHKEDVTIDWNKPFNVQGISALVEKCGVIL